MNGADWSGSFGKFLARLILVAAGVPAMIWSVVVFPTFSSEMAIVNVAKSVAAGEVFKPEILAAIGTEPETGAGRRFRSSILSSVAIIRLRQAEDAIRTKDTARIDLSLKHLGTIVDTSLMNAPSDAFLWLARFWLKNYVSGFRLENLRDLRMSYQLGRYEGWVSTKRNRLALAYYSVMPEDLTELAISEFVGLVRWRIANEAASIAAGPGRQLRPILFSRLKDLTVDQRRPFADQIYRRELDDVPVPGFSPPTPKIPLPVLPPGF